MVFWGRVVLVFVDRNLNLRLGVGVEFMVSVIRCFLRLRGKSSLGDSVKGFFFFYWVVFIFIEVYLDMRMGV